VLNFKKDIWPIIEAESVSSVVKDSIVKVNSKDFKPLSGKSLTLINAKVENEMKIQMAEGSRKAVKDLTTLKDIRKSASSFGHVVQSNYLTGKDLLQTADSMMQRDVAPYMSNGFSGAVPFANSNIWISPSEAASIYSGKGIPELIIEKKSHSPLLNGIKIKNSMLTAREIDKIDEDVIKYQFDMRIAEALRDSLVFGGALFFPKFKKDTPATTAMSVANLVKYGVIGKDCIDRFVTLDRWNTVFTPDWNPLSAGFLKPPSYFIPPFPRFSDELSKMFKGCDFTGCRLLGDIDDSRMGSIGYTRLDRIST